MKFTEKEIQLLNRHYTKIKIFGKVFLWWNTSPRIVLRHLQELNVKNFTQSNVIKSVCSCGEKWRGSTQAELCRDCGKRLGLQIVL
jgi:hypothetical protein